jgi:hypothetical protein
MLVNQHAYRRLVCSSKADLESINMALTDHRTLLHGDLRTISNHRAVWRTGPSADIYGPAASVSSRSQASPGAMDRV